MEDFTDTEGQLTALHEAITTLMADSIHGGMEEEQAIFVAGNVALICMEMIPRTEEGFHVLQNFINEVNELDERQFGSLISGMESHHSTAVH